MGFISNALGFNNSYTNTSGAGQNTTAQQATDETTLANALAGQGTLAQQLQAQATGQGPNIANLQLQQATNQNNQQAAAALASQRGMNPALAQRIIAQQAATNNQNAAGQAGVLRAQQQLSAQNQLGNVYAQQAGEGAQNLATLTQAQTAANNSNAAAAGQNAGIGAGLVGGVLGGASSAVSSILGAAKGGEIKSPHKHFSDMLISMGNIIKPKKYYDGDTVTQSYNGQDPADIATDQVNAVEAATPLEAEQSPSALAAGLSGFSNGMNNFSAPPMAALQSPVFANTPPQLSQGIGPQSIGLSPILRAHGGKVPAMISPGERVIPPEYVKAVREGKKKASEVAPKVPGKAKVRGDDERNDVVPANLAEDSVVVKRTKADNDADAREFLKAIQAEKKKKDGPQGYAKVLEMRRKRSA